MFFDTRDVTKCDQITGSVTSPKISKNKNKQKTKRFFGAMDFMNKRSGVRECAEL